MAETTTDNDGKRNGVFARLWSRIARRHAPVESKGVTATGDVGWTALGGSRFNGFVQGSKTNWEERAGVLWENPAVALCVSYLFDKVAEPKLEITRQIQGGEEEPAQPAGALARLLDLLSLPNGEYDGISLLQAVSLSYKLCGTAYIVKTRSGRGSLVDGLWYVPHWQMAPVAPDDGGPTREFERTVYIKGKAIKTRFPREDVIQFRRGIDPANPRCGMDLFRAMLRPIVTDSQIDNYTAAILTNMGVTAGVVGSNDPENPLSPSERDELKRLLDDRTTGDNAGSWLVSSLPLKIDTLSQSPQSLALDKIGERPEARILAAFGFNAMALGLPSDDKKYANLKESREMAMESGIIPMLGDIAATLTAELLPEFDTGARGGLRIRFNYAGVGDLQPDQDKLSARYINEWKTGIRRLSEARAAVGLDEDPETDGYAWQLMPRVTQPDRPADTAPTT